jgi:hypothetical protein
MWVCPRIIDAASFWGDLITAQGTGIKINDSGIDSMARKNGCEYRTSDHFKVIATGSQPILGQPSLKVACEGFDGWVPAEEYVQYMRYHIVRKP